MVRFNLVTNGLTFSGLETLTYPKVKSKNKTYNNMSNEEQNGNITKPVLSEVVLEAILNDVQIKTLNQRLNELVQYNSPRYVQQTNGEFMSVNSVQFDEVFEKIKEQITIRQEQIMSHYNFR